MAKESVVKDYMTRDVISVKEDTLLEDVIKTMQESNHNSYPVITDDNHLIGMVTAFDLIMKDWAYSVKEVMSKDVVIAVEKMSINDASRVMFRHGISRLPVVDEKGLLVGIITNTDMVRSHIERSTPNKAEYFKTTLEQLYGIKTKIIHEEVKASKLRPTQDRVYADELEGRIYELKRGLAEPVIAIHVGNRWILVDGHHRALAARKLGYEEIDAYVIQFAEDVSLGLEKTADKMGVANFNDVKIIDDAQHPLIAITESIKQSRKNKKND